MHTLTIDGLDTDLRVIEFSGVESLGELFAFEIAFVAPEVDVAFADVTGRPALLTIQSGPEPRLVHGVISRLERASPARDQVGYRVAVVPTIHALAQRRTSRIFQDLAVPAIVERVFAEAGLSSSLRLSLQRSYAARTYCVQYRETDWSFVARLLEEEGIHTYFEHAEGADVLVAADAASAHAPISGTADVTFRPRSDALLTRDAVLELVTLDQLRAGKATVRDYDFRRPSLVLEGTNAGAANTDIEVYDHPGGFVNPSEASAVAERRLEELSTPKRTARGASWVARLLPGFTFTLLDHPTEALNAAWLVTRVEHRGREADFEARGDDRPVYENDFDVVPAGVEIRPPRLTPKPLVPGVQTATVVGPAGEEIHVDSFGRIRVMFHWDRAPKGDANTCWIRVAQPWAGPGFGAMFLPRVGHEVVVAFEEGDPDRPLVTGSIYHGTNVPPYALPGERTKSTVKSRSSPGGAGFNELRFEDRAGGEEIYLHAQKDYVAETLHDERRTVGNDASLTVAKNRTKMVGVNETVTIGANESITIGANFTGIIGATATIGLGGSVTGTVAGSADIQIQKSHTKVVGETMTLQVDGDASTSIGKAFTEHVTGGKNVSIGESYTLSVEKDAAVAIDGKATEDVGKEKTVTVGTTYTLTCGDAKITLKKNGDIEIQGKQIKIDGSGPVKVHGSKLEVESDGTVKVQASGSVKVTGGTVDIN
jgi:type VI secretion system secreted protein VgrG